MQSEGRRRGVLGPYRLRGIKGRGEGSDNIAGAGHWATGKGLRSPFSSGSELDRGGRWKRIYSQGKKQIT